MFRAGASGTRPQRKGGTLEVEPEAACEGEFADTTPLQSETAP